MSKAAILLSQNRYPLPKLALRADPQEQQIGAGLQECYEGRGRKSKEGKALRHQILFLQDKADVIGARIGSPSI
jgi:hypothetical protein